MDEQLANHYAHRADSYDTTWGHRPDYLDWMEHRIHRRLALRPGLRIADIGAGTGLFLRRLMRHASQDTPVVCADPSPAMLGRLPSDPRLLPVRATAEELATGTVGLPWPALDGIVIKEAVHHFSALDRTLAGLARLLAPGGRIVVVTLPPKTGYPLFAAARDRFAARQPEPAQIAGALEQAGLRTVLETDAYPVRIDREEWLKLVAGRWMSVLSSFPDGELDAGLREIAERYPAGELAFDDRFAFITGERPAGQDRG